MHDDPSMTRSKVKVTSPWKSFHFQKLSLPFTMGAGN